MKREEVLDEILDMLTVKRNLTALLNKMTEEIDLKAKEVKLTSYERTKLILKVNEIMNSKKS